jgi:hypothetical protein
MIDETWETIIHEDLDGVASPEDRARLRELIARDPAVRAYYQDMQALSRSLREVGLEEPPASLKAGILRAVDRMPVPSRPMEPAPHPPAAGSWWGGLIAAFLARPVLGGGFVFASGIAVGLLLFTLFGHSPTLDPQGLTGSMTPTEQIQRLGQKTIDFEGVHGRMETGLSNQGPCLYLELDASAEAEITVAFADPSHTFRGFHQERPENGLVSFDAGGLRILHHGTNRYLLTESPETPGDVQVRIHVGDRTLEEHLPFTR